MKTLICPHTETCLIYENWLSQTKDNRLNVIRHNEGIEYSCLALDATNDSVNKGGILINDELQTRIEGSRREVGCSHIEMLNLLNKEGK